MKNIIINTTHVTIFGDSISKGLYLDDNLNVKKLDDNLSSIIEREYDIEITNNSIFGQTLERFYKKGTIDNYINSYLKIREENPNYSDTVIICLGGNDSDYKWDEVEKEPSFNHQPKTNIYEFEMMLSDIILKLKKIGIEVILTTLFPIESNRFFYNVLSKKYNGERIKEFLNNDLSNISRHQEIFSNKICEVAFKYNLKIIDIRNLFLNERRYIDFTCNDGLHPNQDAQYYIFNQLFNPSKETSIEYSLEFAY